MQNIYQLQPRYFFVTFTTKMSALNLKQEPITKIEQAINLKLDQYHNLIHLTCPQSDQDQSSPNLAVFTQEDINQIALIHQKQQQELSQIEKDKKKTVSQSKGNKYRTNLTTHLLNQVKRRFQRYQQQYKCQKQFKKIAKELNMSVSGLYGYYKEWKNDPQMKKKQRQILKNKKVTKNGRGIEELTQKRCQAVIDLLNIHRKWKLQQIADILNKDPSLIKYIKNKPEPIRLYHLSRIMAGEGYRRIRIYKKIKAIRNPQAIKEREAYCKIYLEYVHKFIPVYYYFAINIDVYFKRRYGWYKQSQIENINSPLIIGETGILLTAFACPDGTISWNIEHEYLTEELFVLTFLKHLSILPEDVMEDKKIIVLQKNDLTMNHAIESYLMNINMKTLYLPAKNYRLNPLNGWFFKIKQKIDRQQFQNLGQIMIELDKVCISQISVRQQIKITKQYAKASVYDWTARNID